MSIDVIALLFISWLLVMVTMNLTLEQRSSSLQCIHAPDFVVVPCLIGDEDC